MKTLKPILAIIGIVLGLLITVWGGYTYLEKYATAEEVKKLDQKSDKVLQMMDEKTEKMQKIMDYKFSSYELKVNEDRIYEKEKETIKNPKDATKRADLEKLKREREKILLEMKEIKERK